MEAAEHSLHVAAKEFKKIHEPKSLKLKYGYSAIATLICNSRLRDIDMYISNYNLTDHETVQLLKDFTTEHTYWSSKVLPQYKQRVELY